MLNNIQPVFIPSINGDGHVSLKVIYGMFIDSVKKRVPELEEEANNVMLKHVGLYKLNNEQCDHGANRVQKYYTLLRNALQDCSIDEATLEFIKLDVFTNYGQYVFENTSRTQCEPKLIFMENKVRNHIDSITTLSIEKKNQLDIPSIAKGCINRIETTSAMDPSYMHDDIDDVIEEHVNEAIMDLM